MTFKPNTHLSHGDAEKLTELFNKVKAASTYLSQDEYKFVKSIEWNNQKKFLKAHLTPDGYEEYRNLPSNGRYGKYKGYVDLFNLLNSPLMKALS